MTHPARVRRVAQRRDQAHRLRRISVDVERQVVENIKNMARMLAELPDNRERAKMLRDVIATLEARGEVIPPRSALRTMLAAYEAK